MRNVKSDVAFFIGNDTVDTNQLETLDTEFPVHIKENRNKENSNGPVSHFYSNIIDFTIPKEKGKQKNNIMSNRSESSKTLDLGHTECAQTISLLDPRTSCTTNGSESGTLKKSRYSGKSLLSVDS